MSCHLLLLYPLNGRWRYLFPAKITGGGGKQFWTKQTQMPLVHFKWFHILISYGQYAFHGCTFCWTLASRKSEDLSLDLYFVVNDAKTWKRQLNLCKQKVIFGWNLCLGYSWDERPWPSGRMVTVSEWWRSWSGYLDLWLMFFIRLLKGRNKICCVSLIRSTVVFIHFHFSTSFLPSFAKITDMKNICGKNRSSRRPKHLFWG